VVRLIEASLGVDWEVHRAPGPVAERMLHLLAQIADGGGPIADFGYSPEFAARVDAAREQIAATELDAAWDTVRAALPLWTPMSTNHLAPLGLYYDKDLRRLLTPPPPATDQRTHPTVMPADPIAPSGIATVVPLADRKLHSERTLTVLTTAYQSR
jgi:hypothetical protein